MGTRLLLIRHGMCDPVGKTLSGQTPGVHLNQEGQSQAGEIATRLAGRPIRAIYASSLERTVETAKPLSQALDLPIQKCDGLKDFDFGRWTGAAILDLKQDHHWERFNSFRSFTRAPDGETMFEVQSRALEEIEIIWSRHPDQEIAVFSHGDVIKSIIAYALGLGLDEIFHFEISPASISVLDISEWGFRVMAINNVSGLT